ncbi:MAG: hypothetical protein LUG98_05200, partial [Tannerellaceae bacterium]|nr:hypothetical protein [Tannerellaceae bacterium]
LNDIQEFPDTKKFLEAVVDHIGKSQEFTADISYQPVREGEFTWKFEVNKRDQAVNHDYRLKKIVFENFRKFPAPAPSKPPYGISFQGKDEQPFSAIILGANGVGKSSVFNGMEYLYRGEIGEMKFRNFGNNKISRKESTENFVTYWNNEYKVVKAEIETCFVAEAATGENPETNRQGVFNLEKPLPSVNHHIEHILKNCFFISEFNIFEFGQLKYNEGGLDSIRMKIANAVDIGDLTWFHWLICELATGSVKCWNEETEKWDLQQEEDKYRQEKERLDRQEKYLLDSIFLLNEDRSGLENALVHFLNLDLSHIPPFVDDLIHFILYLQRLLDARDYRKVAELERSAKEHRQSIDNCKKKLLEFSKIKNTLVCREIEQIDIQIVQVLDSIFKHSFWKVLSDFIRVKNSPGQRISPKRVKNVTNEAVKLRQLIQQFDVETSIESRSRYAENVDISAILEVKDELQGDSPHTILTSFIERKVKNETEKEILTSRKEQLLTKRINECIIQEAREIYGVINEPLRTCFNDALADVKPVVDDVMRIFLNNEEIDWQDEKLCIQQDGSDWILKEDFCSIAIKEKPKEGEELPEEKIKGISPKKYFNTFRYKLFAAMLNIGVSFAMKKRNNLNVPLVLDDVFHSSDFKNKIYIQHFINSIIKSHDRIFRDGYLPLQLILFTHDEMIFHSIKEEMERNRDIDIESDTEPLLRFFRLLDYKDAEPNNELQINNLVYEY